MAEPAAGKRPCLDPEGEAGQENAKRRRGGEGGASMLPGEERGEPKSVSEQESMEEMDENGGEDEERHSDASAAKNPNAPSIPLSQRMQQHVLALLAKVEQIDGREQRQAVKEQIQSTPKTSQIQLVQDLTGNYAPELLDRLKRITDEGRSRLQAHQAAPAPQAQRPAPPVRRRHARGGDSTASHEGVTGPDAVAIRVQLSRGREAVARVRPDKVDLSEYGTLAALPEDLRRLAGQLRELEVRSTALEALPAWVGELSRLEVLRVGVKSNYSSLGV